VDSIAAGEVRSSAAMQPEGGVGDRPAIERWGHFARQRQAPIGAAPVEVGELGEGEGGADPQPQLVANRVDDGLGAALSSLVVAQRLQRPPAVFPLEEGVVDRVARPQWRFRFAIRKVVRLIVLLPAASVAVRVSR
jgi:hypothetical protein